jgi:hypothetical protein
MTPLEFSNRLKELLREAEDSGLIPNPVFYELTYTEDEPDPQARVADVLMDYFCGFGEVSPLREEEAMSLAKSILEEAR